jgi:tetratricopeptide (TPR) repeat protein
MNRRRGPRFACIAVTVSAVCGILWVSGAPSELFALAPADLRGSADALGTSPVEVNLLLDAVDGRWDQHTLFTAGQIASGVTSDAQLLAAALDFAKLAAELKSSLPLPSEQSIEDRGHAVLSILHRRLFWGGYDLRATELPRVASTGRYNCVSSAVLFNSLAAEIGLRTAAIRSPNHTRSILFDGDRRLPVEATCSTWFEEQQAANATSTAGGASAAVTAARDTKIEGRIISDVALIGLIYYNRAVEALRQEQLEEAIRLNRIALRLDPQNHEAEGNFAAAINKQAREFCRHEQFDQAKSLLEWAITVLPDYPSLREGRAIVAQRSGENRQEPAPQTPAGN